MKWKSFLKIAVAAGYTLLIILNPMGSLNASKQALEICSNSVVPALFPFFVCSGLLVELNVAGYMSRLFACVMKPVFGLGGGSSFAMILGLISGYPVGAKTTADLVRLKVCSPSEGEKLLAFCNNSGPLFILGAVGSGMLGNPQIGILLYVSHILSSFTVALLMRRVDCEILDRNHSIAFKGNRAFGEILTECIKNAAEMVFTISGFVIVFNILLSSAEQLGVVSALASYGMDYGIAKALVYGLFEPTNGCLAAVRALGGHPVILYLLLSAIIGWSGVSVHMQVLGIIRGCGLSSRYYFIGKGLMTVIAPLYTFLLMRIFPDILNMRTVTVGNMFNLPGVYFNAAMYFALTFIMTAAFLALALVYHMVRQQCGGLRRSRRNTSV